MLQGLKILLSIIFGIYLILGSVPRCDTFYDLSQMLQTQDSQSETDAVLACHEDNVTSASLEMKDDRWTRTGCHCEIMKSHLHWIEQDLNPLIAIAAENGFSSYGKTSLLQSYLFIQMPTTPPPRFV